MADQLEELKKARSAVVNERRTRARAIATSDGAITDSAMDGFIKVQDAIEAIDRAIDELDETEEEYDEEDVDD